MQKRGPGQIKGRMNSDLYCEILGDDYKQTFINYDLKE